MKRSRPARGKGASTPWAQRILLAGAVAALALFSVADSMANAVAARSPQLAHKLAPWNGRIEARLARRSFEARPNGDLRSASAVHARHALAKEPTAVEALSVLALQSQLRGDAATSRQMLAHGLTLSQRELPSRLWAIQEAALRGDLEAVVSHYDIALKTSNAAAARLFPILARALVEPRIRAAVVALFDQQPVWREDFVSYAAREGSNPAATAALFTEAAAAGVPINPDMKTALVDSFANAGDLRSGWQYYQTIRPAAQADRSRDPGFTFAAERRSLFDWNAGEFASFERTGDGGLLSFAVPTATSATLATQALLLPPGRYTLQGISRGISLPEDERPYWMLRCGDQELSRTPLANSGEAEGRFAAQIAVPAGCPLHTLALVAPASDGYRGISGEVLRVALGPADAPRAQGR